MAQLAAREREELRAEFPERDAGEGQQVRFAEEGEDGLGVQVGNLVRLAWASSAKLFVRTRGRGVRSCLRRKLSENEVRKTSCDFERRPAFSAKTAARKSSLASGACSRKTMLFSSPSSPEKAPKSTSESSTCAISSARWLAATMSEKTILKPGEPTGLRAEEVQHAGVLAAQGLVDLAVELAEGREGALARVEAQAEREQHLQPNLVSAPRRRGSPRRCSSTRTWCSA